MDNLAERILEIRDEMMELLEEAKQITRKVAPNQYDGLSAYVFEQISEHLSKGNPYNQDMEDVAKVVESEQYGDEEVDEGDVVEEKDRKNGLFGPEYTNESF